MSRNIEIEISLPSLDRRFRLPPCAPGDCAAALRVLDHWAARNVISPAIISRAIDLLDAISKVQP
jgi:hypothetical protein